MANLTTAEIKLFAARKLQHEEVLSMEDQMKLRKLWLGACACDALLRIATQLEDGQLSLLEGENIANNIKLVADRMHD